MTPRQSKKVNALLTEIRAISSELPKGKSHKVQNRCSKISMIVKKATARQ